MFRKIFKIIFVFLTNRSFFFIHSINSIFRLKVFKFIHNIFSDNQHWRHFFHSKIDYNTYLFVITNWHIFFVIRIVSIIEFENQSIFRQNFQYWQSRINIWIIVDFWKTSKIIFVNLTNWLEFSSFVINLITFRIQISNQFFRHFIFSFNISIKNQYWNYSFFSKSLRNHICFINKRFCFFRFDVEFNIFLSKTTRIF